jgi:hypothetical protein
MTDAWLEKVPGIRDIVDDTEGGAITMPRESKLVIRGAVDLIPEAGALVLDFSGLGAGSLPAVDGDDNGSVLKVVGGVWSVGPADDYDITAFAPVTATVEVGSTVTNPAFTAAHNHAPTSLVLTNSKTAEAKNVVASPTSFFSSAGGQVLSTVGATWVFTLTGSDGSSSDAPTATITARQRNVAGVVGVGNTSPATLYAAAIHSALASSGAFSFTFTDNGTNEVQFFRRAAYGAPTSVKDNATGFGVSYSLVGAFSWTNPSGFAENVNLYKLDNPVNGTKTIVVT